MSTQLRAQVTAASRPTPSYTPVRKGLLQRKCACGGTPSPDGECAECRKKRLSRQHHSAGRAEPTEIPPIVHDVLRSPGQPLDADTRAFMEPRFGHDFSKVRVHADMKAAESARAVNAQAYTVGRDVVFGAGQYAPATTSGRQLLAHELTHALQQGQRAPVGNAPLEVGEARDPLEAEAQQVAVGVNTERHGGIGGRIGATPVVRVQRQAGEALTDPLAYARNLETRYPRWREILPDCPCTDAEARRDAAKWKGGIGGCPDFFHPGAATGYRSKQGYASVPGTSHGQQCCYDAQGRLITEGPGAGTPDVWSPETDFANHQLYDVQTWFSLGWQTYNRYWVPNAGRSCPPNRPAEPPNPVLECIEACEKTPWYLQGFCLQGCGGGIGGGIP